VVFVGILVAREPAGRQEAICTRPGSYYYCYSFSMGPAKRVGFGSIPLRLYGYICAETW